MINMQPIDAAWTLLKEEIGDEVDCPNCGRLHKWLGPELQPWFFCDHCDGTMTPEL